jgi:hypothetical protein
VGTWKEDEKEKKEREKYKRRKNTMNGGKF